MRCAAISLLTQPEMMPLSSSFQNMASPRCLARSTSIVRSAKPVCCASVRSAGESNLIHQQSLAFAVSDHQIAHVYVRDESRIAETAALLRILPGVERVLDEDGKRAAGLDHERSGELIAVAQHDAWFTWYHWLDDAKAPDFARTVEIHRKPGYDPVELFIDPSLPFSAPRGGDASRKTSTRLSHAAGRDTAGCVVGAWIPRPSN